MIMRFSKVFHVVAFIAFVAGMFGLAPEAEARKIRLRLTTLAPKDSSFHKSLLKMREEWKKATKGQVNLIIFAGGVQGGETAMIDRMRIRQMDAALLTGIGLAEIDPGVAILQKVPLLYRSYEELEHVFKEYGPVLENRLQDKGFVALAWIDSGWVRIFSKTPIQVPEDMEKVKLFTWTGDTPQTDLLKKMGFRPVPIDSTEITPAMQTGLIDTVPLPPFYGLAMQTYRAAPHMLDFNYTPIVGAIVVSEGVWKRIPEESQIEMRRIAQETAREMTANGRKENEDAIAIMRDQWNLNVHSLNDEERKAWEATSEEAYSIIRDSTVPADVWDEVIGILREHRAN